MGPQVSATSLGCLLLAAFFPGCIYFAAVFPISMVLFFVLLSIFFLGRKQWLSAGIAGGVAAFVYPSAALFSVVAGVWVVAFMRKLGLKGQILAGLRAVGLTVCGFASVLLWDWHKTGHWDAFFLIQSRFKHGDYLPYALWARKTAAFFLGLDHLPNAGWADVGIIPALQTIFTAMVVVVSVTVFFRSKEHDQGLWLIVLYAVAFWIFPWCVGGSLSQYRSEALVMPVSILCRRLPASSIWILAVLAILIAAPMAALFFRNVLI